MQSYSLAAITSLVCILFGTLGYGCASPCNGTDGSCLDLHIDGVGSYSRLEITTNMLYSMSPKLVAVVDQNGDLPARVLLTPPPNISSSSITELQVNSFLGKNDLDPNQSGSLPMLSWPDAAHIEASITLASIISSQDFGATSTDASVIGDLGAPSDPVALPPDLGCINSPCNVPIFGGDGVFCANIIPKYECNSTDVVTCKGGVVTSIQPCLSPKTCQGALPSSCS